MSYAEFAPVTQEVDKKKQEPIILDVPKVVAPSPSPTTVHVSYPFKLTKEDVSTWTWGWSWSFLAFFAIVWMIAGLVAFVVSLVCFAYDGTVVEKIAGLLLAFVFGPFYWIYYFTSSTYCKST